MTYGRVLLARGRDRVDDAETFAAQHGDWLGRCAFMLVGDPEAAADLTQDTLLTVWRK